ncbi:MAG: M48 family metallopeptidase [Kiritimatiellia bacterium]
MDFFELQENARKKTKVLVFYFLLTIIGIVAALYLIFVGIMTLGSETPQNPWQPELLGVVTLGVLLLVVLGSLYKIAMLRGGGATIAQSLGGSLVPPNTRDFKERRLLNVVEEMAIAAGIPPPPVYVQRDEKAINAFAAGYSQDTAIVCVTQGCLDALSREELQGVIGHEFSHILSGDMRLNIRLIGLLHGILLISLIGRIILRSMGRSRGNKKGGGGIALVALAMMIIGSIGVLFGRLIKSAVARQREYLADASAVQFTRDTTGIASALKKIGGFALGSRIQCAAAEEASHMFFSNGLRQSLFSLMATHPPLDERIRQLDPSWDGQFIAPSKWLPDMEPETKKAEKKSPFGALPKIPGLPDVLSGPLPGVMALSADSLGKTVGTPRPENVAAAQAAIANVPEDILDAARDPFGAQALIYALLLDEGKTEPLARQMDWLKSTTETVIREQTEKFRPAVQNLPQEAEPAIIDICRNSLLSLSEKQYRFFLNTVDQLIAADGELDLFEYMVQHLLVRMLKDHFSPRQHRTAPIYSIKALAPGISTILSSIAHVGNDESSRAAEAFRHALGSLSAPAELFELLPADRCTFEGVDAAADQLIRAEPGIKKQVLAACMACLSHDRTITREEGELFRAVAAGMGCPVPFIVPG